MSEVREKSRWKSSLFDTREQIFQSVRFETEKFFTFFLLLLFLLTDLFLSFPLHLFQICLRVRAINQVERWENPRLNIKNKVMKRTWSELRNKEKEFFLPTPKRKDETRYNYVQIQLLIYFHISLFERILSSSLSFSCFFLAERVSFNFSSPGHFFHHFHLFSLLSNFFEQRNLC